MRRDKRQRHFLMEDDASAKVNNYSQHRILLVKCLSSIVEGAQHLTSVFIPRPRSRGVGYCHHFVCGCASVHLCFISRRYFGNR